MRNTMDERFLHPHYYADCFYTYVGQQHEVYEAAPTQDEIEALFEIGEEDA